MPEFSYKVLDQQRREQSGIMVAESKEGVAEILKNLEFFILEIKEEGKRKTFLGKGLGGVFGYSIPTPEKLVFVDNLATMLRAGVSIREALDTMLEEGNSRLKEMVIEMRSDVEKGRSLSYAMARFPNVFDDVSVGLVRSGEEGGNLDLVLDHLSENILRDYQLNQKVRGAMVYPAVVMSVLIMVLLFLLFFVIPRIADVFIRLGVTLPLPTKIMVGAAVFLKSHIILSVIFIVLVVIGLVILSRSKSFRAALVRLLARLPVVKDILQEFDLAKVSRVVSMLLTAGTPIIKTLEFTEGVVSDQHLRGALFRIRNLVTEGSSVADAMLKEKQFFPPVVTRITRAGEKSGTLDKMMTDLSRFYEGKVTYALNNLSTLIEPVLIVIIGLIVGGVVISIISPIYQLVGQIKTG